MKEILIKQLNKLPYIKKLKQQVDKQGRYFAGHYYSPIPEQDDVLEYIEKHRGEDPELSDIDLQDDAQSNTLSRYKEFYSDLPFTERAGSCRYCYDQGWFCYSDAIFLYCFLRDKKPTRIVEVGSGYSSAVMLDTVELFYSKRPEITFIDPYPDRLHSILRDDDRQYISILETPVQQIPKQTFTDLGNGDLLFIDSSHVLKLGSDLHYLFFEIMPLIEKGVYVHFHDIMYPFEYLDRWLKEGRYWNEAYVLRAFLAYNNSWRVHFFSSYVGYKFQDFLKENMPLCLKDTGGSIYIQRV